MISKTVKDVIKCLLFVYNTQCECGMSKIDCDFAECGSDKIQMAKDLVKNCNNITMDTNQTWKNCFSTQF